MPLSPRDLQFFDPKQDYSVCWKRLPHWAQAGTVVFITWRTKDSVPAPILRRFERERNDLLQQHGIDPATDWKSAISKLPLDIRRQVQWNLFDRWDEKLDACHGACVLRKPDLSKVVADSLLKFDGERYLMTDFVVMPNHLHFLAAFRSEEAMLSQCTEWKRYMAREINRALKQKDDFWQVEAFDHLVRSPEWFEHYRRYIAENPLRARLRTAEFRHYSRDLVQENVEPRSGPTT
jgi:REP-associated tyrosine transposase